MRKSASQPGLLGWLVVLLCGFFLVCAFFESFTTAHKEATKEHAETINTKAEPIPFTTFKPTNQPESIDYARENIHQITVNVYGSQQTLTVYEDEQIRKVCDVVRQYVPNNHTCYKIETQNTWMAFADENRSGVYMSEHYFGTQMYLPELVFVIGHELGHMKHHHRGDSDDVQIEADKEGFNLTQSMKIDLCSEKTKTRILNVSDPEIKQERERTLKAICANQQE